ncbi:hypothetical protein PM8797T_09699 [Gimesia maris DSM 8797]|nr:hypothetical protein PM8797T_09699 [Gimesia maris DSM 8797]
MVGYLLTNQWVPDEADPLLEEFSFIEIWILIQKYKVWSFWEIKKSERSMKSHTAKR